MVKNLLFVCVILCISCLNSANPRKKRQWPFASRTYVCPLKSHASPFQYYHMGSHGERFERRCADNLVFSEAACTCIFPPNDCTGMAESRAGRGFYLQNEHGRWKTRLCAPGTLYNPITCKCDIFRNQGFRFQNDMDDLLKGM